MPAEKRRYRGRGSSSSSVRSSSVGEGAAKRGSRIPDDFVVSQEMVVWARHECPDVDGRLETARFIDYFKGAPGVKGVKQDWPATWRNWMRKEQRDAVARGPRVRPIRQAPPLPTDAGEAFEDLRGRAAALEASRLLGVAFIPAPQPPSDKTPHQQWQHSQSVQWIEAHEQQIRTALAERSAC